MNRWMDKENVVCIYSGILFSLKKEINPVTIYNMGEPLEHYKGDKHSQRDKWGI